MEVILSQHQWVMADGSEIMGAVKSYHHKGVSFHMATNTLDVVISRDLV